MRINWSDKAQNLREIVSELNIGIDSLAFLDDNPVEREQVRAALPEVTVIELSDDRLEYAATLRDCPAFERLTLAAEDQQRTAFYVEQRERFELGDQILLSDARCVVGHCRAARSDREHACQFLPLLPLIMFWGGRHAAPKCTRADIASQAGAVRHPNH